MRTAKTELEIQEYLRSFKGLILDGDGVFFTGQEFRGVLPTGESVIIKPRHHHDSQGIAFIRSMGIKVLFATVEGEPLLSIVEKLNNLPSVKEGRWEKIDVLSNFLEKKGVKTEGIEGWLSKHGLTWEDCAYVGDDRSDWEGMQLAGLSITPKNGMRLIREIADIVLSKDGGMGAVREFCEMVVDARGRKEIEFTVS